MVPIIVYLINAASLFLNWKKEFKANISVIETIDEIRGKEKRDIRLWEFFERIANQIIMNNNN